MDHRNTNTVSMQCIAPDGVAEVIWETLQPAACGTRGPPAKSHPKYGKWRTLLCWDQESRSKVSHLAPQNVEVVGRCRNVDNLPICSLDLHLPTNFFREDVLSKVLRGRDCRT